MWKLELDEEYYRIYDSKKMIAGYFDPDYGDIQNPIEVIPEMVKHHEKVPGGYIMLPLVKFSLFDTDLNIGINILDSHISRVSHHISQWKDFLSKMNIKKHSIRISHTDQDMLTITFPIRFSAPTMLKESDILREIEPILQTLQKLRLL